jgi:hypothetical protein
MIQPQFLNLANSSFLLFLEHYILEKGSGFSTGVSSQYYPIGRTFNNYYAYSSPYQPQIFDSSITVPMTGIYVNGTFYQRGQGSFQDIDYKRNIAYFTAPVSSVSGYFPINDINILPLEVPEEVLLFEKKFSLRKPNSYLSGIQGDSYTYPCIYVKEVGSNNRPFAFGGEQESDVNIGLIILAESSYQLGAIKGILCDMQEEIFPFFTADKFPLNVFGGFKETGSNFNYNTLKTGYLAVNSGCYIKNVTVNSFDRFQNADFSKLNPDVYYAIADVTFCKTRYPRSTSNNL